MTLSADPLPTVNEVRYAALKVGCLPCHSVACSYACAIARTVDSANGAPTIWRPIGRPEVVKPQGTEIAGSPSRSKGDVLRMLTIVGSPPCAIVTGGAGGVGGLRRCRGGNTSPTPRRA